MIPLFRLSLHFLLVSEMITRIYLSNIKKRSIEVTSCSLKPLTPVSPLLLYIEGTSLPTEPVDNYTEFKYDSIFPHIRNHSNVRRCFLIVNRKFDGY